MTDRAPLSIVVAGGGTAGWTAAAVFARFLGRHARITLVESDAIGTVGVGEATIPQIHNLLVGLGIDQAEFVRATGATFKLGIEFAGWRDRGHAYLHSFGQVGRGIGLTAFRQLWLRGRALGVAGNYGDYSLNVAAARAGRFAIGDGAGGALPDLAYAYHFDALLFARLLRDYAQSRGVRRVEGRIAAVERHGETGDVAALRLDGERTVAGDLFIDCTGFRSLLLGEALGVPFVDWSEWLPCDTALAVPCASVPGLTPYTRATARPAGWQWRIPLQHRTGNGHVFCSAFTTVDEAAAILLANLDGAALGEPRPIRFTTGHRERFWAHNCVGLGLAAGFMEPLESTSIHLVQSGIGRLLDVLGAGRADNAAARDSFNRLSAIEWERVRDFLVLHYVANERHGEPFWDHCRAMTLPPLLAEKLALFAQSGAFMREADELFLDDSWAQVMLGQGIQPRGWSPLADDVPGAEIGPYLATLARAYRLKAESLPTHRAFVDAFAAAPARKSA